jgi:hypothetical protein
VVAQLAAWSFIYRFIARKSSEYPEGLLDGEVLKSFYSITGDYPNFEYTPGYEKIPDNWHKRNLVDYYTIFYLTEDALDMSLQYPEFLSIGGKTGSVNTFTGVDLQNLTGGVFSANTLLEGNDAICLGFEVSLQEAPDILSGLYSDVQPALDALGSAIDQAASGLGRPTLSEIKTSQFLQFPGYTDLNDGTY